MLELLVLTILFFGPCHGYEIKKNHPGLKINNNSLYPLLKEMQDKGYITSDVQVKDNGVSKKVYTLTDTGKDHLFDLLTDYREEEMVYDDAFYLRVAFFQFLPKEDIRTILDRRGGYLEKLEKKAELMRMLDIFPDKAYDILYLKNYFSSKIFSEKQLINTLREKYSLTEE